MFSKGSKAKGYYLLIMLLRHHLFLLVCASFRQ